MPPTRATRQQLLKQLNALLQDDWSVAQDAHFDTPLKAVNINPAGTDLGYLAASLPGSPVLPEHALRQCRTVGDFIDLLYEAQPRG